MKATDLQVTLQRGDCLLYKPKGFFGAIIKFKSWHDVAHVEIYVGEGKSVASRDGIGVGTFPWRDTDIAYILRPSYELDWIGFWRWFKTVDGQGYDWIGLLRFGWFKSIGAGDNKKMFCSEFAARAYRAMGAHVFGDYEDCDAIAPAQFICSPNLILVATAKDLV